MLLAITLSVALAGPRAKTLIVLNKFDNTASIIDIGSGKTRAKVPVGVGPHEAAVSPNGKTVAVANYGNQKPGTTITLIDIKAGKATKTLDVSPHVRPHGIEWLDHDSILVTSEGEQKLTQVNSNSGAIEKQYNTTQPVPHMLLLAPNKKTLYSTNIGPGTLSAIDVATGKLIAVTKCGAAAEGLEITVDGKTLWVTNGGANSVSIVDAKTMKKLRDIPVGQRPLRAKVTPDGKKAIVTSYQDGQVLVLDAQTYAVLKKIDTGSIVSAVDPSPGGPAPVGVIINPDGSEAYIACNAARKVLVLDLKKLSITRQIDTGPGPDGMALAS